MAANIIQSTFSLAFEISPIILNGGIAKDIPGNSLPIAVFTEALSIVGGVLQGNVSASTKFYPMAGTTLIQQDIGNYNFFNQITAANAVIKKPNRIIMQMITPVNTSGNKYTKKVLTFGALKSALDSHNQAGGSYTILTPAHIYTGCLMRNFVDSSTLSSENKQTQYSWMLEFEQPVLAYRELEQTLTNVLQKFQGELPSGGEIAWSGLKNAVSDGISNIFG
ncbi:hypothetical protein QE197_10890 [Arsenophonus nasoniae]|uniref:Uncharacterized protein n=1 Tax=Arsenophonus nasoniae TaxID=638 RepID=A0ABY8NJI6_9GAMM|nr:hypothetical protein [Arsenophonus nasoniae]WGM04289.1 hypothetical protein QE258_11620 [Arsenophonus nasoniae]WGM09391.1 hypothetical protein QE197_10890 [Arsenophonus nasoniae]WGM14116.1 hypothetical protein QE193_10785 [Arsenophonus nasoniae]